MPVACHRWLLALTALWGGANPLLAQMHPPPLRGETSRIRWSSYVQLRYTGIADGPDLFGLRRLKLMVGGDLNPKIQWYAQGLFKEGNDSPTDGGVHFQEAWLRFAFRKEIQLVAGQFKPAFGRERFTPDFEIYTMDRALVTDALTPDGPYIDSFYRDRGVQIDGELPRAFRYAVGVFDGRGANHRLRGIGPMVVSQLLHQPLRGRLWRGKPLTMQYGLSTAFRWGDDLPFRSCCAGDWAANLERFRGADKRWGLEYSADWGNVSLRAEVMRAYMDFREGTELDFASSGWYLQAAKFIGAKFQAVAKVEAFDPNGRVTNRRDVRQTTLGVNYYILQHRAKIMTSFVMASERVDPVSNNLFQLQFQFFVH